MEKNTREDEKEKREKAAREKHSRLSRLYREDRLAFERERRRMIEDLISSVEEPEKRAKLRALQNRWDKRMRGAGSGHNRFVLAKTFFWEHFHEVWSPTLRKCNALLNGGADTEST